jgi:hypothetical protein
VVPASHEGCGSGAGRERADLCDARRRPARLVCRAWLWFFWPQNARYPDDVGNSFNAGAELSRDLELPSVRASFGECAQERSKPRAVDERELGEVDANGLTGVPELS